MTTTSRKRSLMFGHHPSFAISLTYICDVIIMSLALLKGSFRAQMFITPTLGPDHVSDRAKIYHVSVGDSILGVRYSDGY